MKQELFACVPRNPPKTLPELTSDAAALGSCWKLVRAVRLISALNSQMIGAGAISSYTRRETICSVVGEALRKFFETMPQRQVASLTDVIREEVKWALGRHPKDPVSSKL